MIAKTHGITLNESPNRGSAETTIRLLRQGYDVNFKMRSDEFMREYLDDEDYAFWLKKKAESEEASR